MGNSWSHRLRTIIECTEDVNETPDSLLLHRRETTICCRKLLQVWAVNKSWSPSRYMRKDPPELPWVRQSTAELQEQELAAWEVWPEAASSAASSPPTVGSILHDARHIPCNWNSCSYSYSIANTGHEILGCLMGPFVSTSDSDFFLVFCALFQMLFQYNLPSPKKLL